MSLEALDRDYTPTEAGAIDYALVEKASKNGARLAISQYECAPGGAIYELVKQLIADAIYDLVKGNGELYQSDGLYARLSETVGQELDKRLP